VPLRLYDCSGENDGTGRPGHFGRTGQGSASGTAYMLSGVQDTGPDGSESV